jgi:hypothetical protein
MNVANKEALGVAASIHGYTLADVQSVRDPALLHSRYSRRGTLSAVAPYSVGLT